MASKSLGTLTLDLVARTGGFVQGMNKAERESAKWRRQVERDLRTINAGISRTLQAGAAAAVASTAAITALAKKGLDAVNSQAALAQSLDTTYDSITALKLAAGDANLDGLEGSLTRLNRRLGAAEYGAGAAANAVKALNLDLEGLSRMDADERVASIADAIRDSGVSMQRAARFAQDLGFEQQQAAEFFMQGGDAIRAYRGEVEQLGLSLSEIEVAQVQEAANAMGVFSDLVTSVSQRLAVEFAPVLRQVAADIESAAKETGGFSDEISEMAEKAVRAAAFVADSVDGFQRVVSTVGKTIAVVVLEGQLLLYKLADTFINGPTAAANEFIDVLNKLPWIDIDPFQQSAIGENIQEQIAIITGAIIEGQKDIHEGLMAPMAGQRLIKYYEDAKAAAEGFAESAVRARQERERQDAASQALESYLKLVQELRTNEEKLTDQLYERLAVLDAVAGSASIAGDEYAEMMRRATSAAFAGAPEFAGLAPEVGGAFGELNKIDKAEEELQSWYDTQLEMLEGFRSERADLNAQWDEQEARLRQEHQDRLADIDRARQVAQLEATSELFGDLAGLTKAYAGEQSGIYRTMFAAEKAYSLASTLVNSYDAIAKAWSSAPFPANLPAVAAATASTGALSAAVKAVSLSGMAHDGIDSVPQTGTWLLEKGERVVTSETSAKLDATLEDIRRNGRGSGVTRIEVINNGSLPPMEGEARMGPDGQMQIVVRAVMDQLRGDLGNNRGVWREAQQQYGWAVKGRIG